MAEEESPRGGAENPDSPSPQRSAAEESGAPDRSAEEESFHPNRRTVYGKEAKDLLSSTEDSPRRGTPSRDDVTLLDSVGFAELQERPSPVREPGAKAERLPAADQPRPMGREGTAGADYVLEARIGQGGHGEVWRALQVSLDRSVAVKVIREGRGRSAIDAFIQEAYTTAALDHPNIVPVYDLSRTRIKDRDCHLLAMKLLEGTPWHQALERDRAKPDFDRDRFLTHHLNILLSVCNAVAYAHSKEILHLDLKPSQVVIGNFGEVYLMDWGLAMTLGRTKPPTLSSSEVPKFRTRDSVSTPSGTPAYMAPEQTGATAARIGYHTDIYLLGAVLFEIVSGYPPHRATTMSGAFKMANRNEVVELPAGVPEDLVFTLRRALATEPEDRYATVDEFRDEIEGYLSGTGRKAESEAIAAEVAREVTSAEPDYAGYVEWDMKLQRALTLWRGNERAKKLREEVLGRYARKAVASRDLLLARTLLPLLEEEATRAELAARIAGVESSERELKRQNRSFKAIAAGLLGVLLVALLFLMEHRHQQESAELARRQIERERTEQARLASLFQRLNKLRRSEERLAAEFSSTMPLPRSLDATKSSEEDGPIDPSLAGSLLARREHLRKERAQLNAELGDPDVLGPEPFELLTGEANLKLARARNTEEILEAFERYREANTIRPDSPAPLTGMGISASRAGFFTSATLALADAARLTRELKGGRHPDYAEALALEAEALRSLDSTSQDFVQLYEKSLEILVPQWSRLSDAIANRYAAAGQYNRSMEFSSSSLAMQRLALPEGDLQLVDALATQASALESVGRIVEAERFHREAIELWEAKRGADDVSIGDLYDALATNLSRQGKPSLARPLYEKALEVRRMHLPPDNPRIGSSLNNIAMIRFDMGDYQEAERLFKESLAIWEASMGPDHPYVALAYNNLGSGYTRVGRYEEAEKALLRALKIRKERLGAQHPVVSTTLNNLAALYARTSRFEEAEAMFLESGEIQIRNYGPNHPRMGTRINNLGTLYRRWGKFELAEKHYRQALEIWTNAFGAEHPDIAAALNNLAMLFLEERRWAEAEEYFRRSLAIWSKEWPESHPTMLIATARLASAIVEQEGRAAEAEEMVRRVIRHGTKRTADADRHVALAVLARARQLQGDTGAARALLLHALRRLIEDLGEDHSEVAVCGERLMKLWLQEEASGTRDRNLLVLGAFLEARFGGVKSLGARAGLPGLLLNQYQLTSTTLTIATPRRDLAERLALRTEALARLLELETVSSPAVHEVAGIAERLGLAEAAAALPAPPAELWPDRTKHAKTADVLAWLDRCAAPVDWPEEFPEVGDWSLATLAPEDKLLRWQILEILGVRTDDGANATPVGAR